VRAAAGRVSAGRLLVAGACCLVDRYVAMICACVESLAGVGG
jgi:hypothetical protein